MLGGENINNQYENPKNNTILTINRNEYTDEFRRVQEESLGLSNAEIREYHQDRTSTKFGDENRRRIGGVFKRFLGAGSDGSSNDFWISLKDSKNGNTFRFSRVNGTLFHDIFQINRNYLKNGELVDLHLKNKIYDISYSVLSFV